MKLRANFHSRGEALAIGMVVLLATSAVPSKAPGVETAATPPERAALSDASVDAAPPRRELAADDVRTTPPPGSQPLDLSPYTLRKAIADSRDPADDVRSSGPTAFGTGARGGKVDRAFRDAEIPSCIDGTALRFEPTTIGPIALGGYLLLPLWLHAIATGRCK